MSALENEDEAYGKSQKCLFCAAELPASYYIVVDGKLTHLKKETSDDDDDEEEDEHNFLPSSSSFLTSSEDPRPNKQLQVIFILQNILNIPKRKLSKFLAKFKAQLYQELWKQVCTSCGEEVRQFYEVFQEISLLKRKLDTISKQLKARIHNTNEDVGVGEAGIWEEIRGAVLQEREQALRPPVAKPETILPDYNEDDLDDDDYQDQDDDSDFIPSSPSSSNSSSGRISPDFNLPNEDDNVTNDIHSNPDSEEDKPFILEIQNNTYTPPLSSSFSPEKRKVGRPKKSSSPKRNKSKREYFYGCSKCPATYRTTEFLEAHLKLHEKLESNSPHDCIPCKKCGWLLTNKTLRRHMGAYHVKGKKKRLSIRASGLKKHGIPYYCDYCQMIYINRALLQNHFASYHANTVGFLRCQETKCTDEFESQQLLDFHMEHVHKKVINKAKFSDEETEQKCPHCEDKFKSKLEVDYHIAVKHRDILLTCKSCNINFTNYGSYQNHMARKYHAGSHPFTCELCGKIYWTERHLYLHRRQEHFETLGIVPISCKLCGKILCDEKYLENHMNVVHENVKKFACEFCGKGFTQRNNLRNHLKAFHQGPLVNNPGEIPQGKHYSVSEEGKYVCEFCSESFLTLQHVRKHLLSGHFNEIKYCCEACPKKFCAWIGLHNHRKHCVELKKLNGGEGKEEKGAKQRFPCDFCSKTFSRVKTMREHRKKVHKDKFEHVCCQCDKVFCSFANLTSHRRACVAKGQDDV